MRTTRRSAIGEDDTIPFGIWAFEKSMSALWVFGRTVVPEDQVGVAG
jgi:uncharacterized membrane protein YccF (DUF307 family)